MLFAGRILDGITGRQYFYCSGFTLQHHDQRGLRPGDGLIGAAFGLGFIFGPAIGGY